MKPGLSLRASQHLALTPQLQQSIRLLQLSTLELAQEVEQMLDENPFLEKLTEDDARATREDFGVEFGNAPAAADTWESSAPASHDSDVATLEPEPQVQTGPDGLDWDGDGTVEMGADDSEWGIEATASSNNRNDSEESERAVNLSGTSESLSEHLWRQALSLHLEPEDASALRYLIESLNDDGYLEDTLEDLVAALQPEDEERREDWLFRLQLALRYLHQLEPAGVGARHLAECMSLQLLDRPNTEATRCAMELCKLPLEMLAKRDLKKLAVASGYTDTCVREALMVISRLEPKPGRRFAAVEKQYLIPDVIVRASGSGPRLKLDVQLNPEVMPRLKVHDIYANALKGYRGDKGEGYAGLQQRLTEARWFIKNIQQRFDTILRVSRAIVERQRNFFVHGELAMRPLVLREIADELGLHESTISRVTTAKYMATPFGTFELKYFFGSSLGTDAGGNASSTAVRALIKQFIAAEDTAKPLSDNAIADMLKEQGIDCARRTVAKYREGLKIPTASLRKAR
jgi:RNA polymerase sigma-54 factor